LAPSPVSEKVDAALPVADVITPMCTVSLVMPGALAVLLAGLPQEAPVAAAPDPVEAAVVAVEAVFLALLQPPTNKAPAPTSAVNLHRRGFTVDKDPPSVTDLYQLRYHSASATSKARNRRPGGVAKRIPDCRLTQGVEVVEYGRDVRDRPTPSQLGRLISCCDVCVSYGSYFVGGCERS
jgi:hypothetical protein